MENLFALSSTAPVEAGRSIARAFAAGHRPTARSGFGSIRAATRGRRWLAEESRLRAGDQQTLLRPVRQTCVATIDAGEVMVALRVFVPETEDQRQTRIILRPDRLVSVSDNPFPAFDECVSRLERGRGPKTVTDVVLLAFRVGAERDQLAACKLDEDVAELEYSGDIAQSLETLRDVWLRASDLRRRLAAGREALMQLKQLGASWLVGGHGDLWRDALASSAG